MGAAKYILAFSVLFLSSFAPLAQGSNLPACASIWRPGEWRLAPVESNAQQSARLARPACAKEWTILVYMAPTDDLLPFALSDLNEMRAPFSREGQAASSLKTDLIVQLETEAGPASRLHLFAGEPISSIDDARAKPVGLAPSGKNPAAALSDFLRWGAKAYPAKNYFVVVWGHGRGWKGYELARGTLETLELRSALQDFVAAAGKPADVLASDSCFVQTTENIYALNGAARFIAGSSGTQNFLGLPYRRILYEINTGRFNGLFAKASPADRADEAKLLARMLPELTRQSLDPARGSQGGGSAATQALMTASTFDGARFGPEIAPAFKALGSALEAYLKEDSLRGLDIQLLFPSEASAGSGGVDVGALLTALKTYLAMHQDEASRVRGELASALSNAEASS
ncbi:MAG: hypothetical protein EOP11_03995 [Proteobacteria bacterium]|nr:MAG: hypothetical protein EOP11_03995 [Pseudomonadota bacterium]